VGGDSVPKKVQHLLCEGAAVSSRYGCIDSQKNDPTCLSGSGDVLGVGRVNVGFVALEGEKVKCSPELVCHIMRDYFLIPCQPRPFRITTQADVEGEVMMKDLTNRDFVADWWGVNFVGGETTISSGLLRCSDFHGWASPLRLSLMSTQSRREDVQGLRALAVAGVLLFHFDLGLPGGFAGVDVFFVISGFVIWRILTKEVSVTGSVDISRFLAGRFFRLVPAMGAVVLTTLLASSLVFTSRILQETTAWTAVSALLAVSNFVIAYVSGGYFGQAAEANPLLHTWSLSVEWQFYLLVPLLILLARALSKRGSGSGLFFGTFLLLLGVSSFLFNFLDLPDFAGRIDLNGFYSPIGRFWEFAAGALASQLVAKLPLTIRLAEFVSIIGLTAIIGSFVLYHEGMQTPGRSTLVPVVATVLMIWGGAEAKSAITRLMSLRPLALLGDLSYSIYLWHWPVLFYWRQTGLSDSIVSTAGLIMITLGLSWLTFNLVENPLRLSRVEHAGGTAARSGGRRISAALFFLLSPMLVLGMWSVGSGSYQKILLASDVVESIPGDIGHTKFHKVVAEEFEECADSEIKSRALSWDGFVRCQQTSGDEAVEIAIIGDSHAEHLFFGLAGEVPDREVAYYILNELPILGGSQEMADIVQHVAETDSIRTVVVSAFWVRRGVPSGELRETVDYLRAFDKRVVITNDIPTVEGITPEGCKTSLYIFGPRVCSWIDPNHESAAEISGTLKEIADNTGADFVDTYGLFCIGLTCEMTTQTSTQNGGEVLLYRDPNHLNLSGSEFVAKALSQWVR